MTRSEHDMRHPDFDVFIETRPSTRLLDRRSGVPYFRGTDVRLADVVSDLLFGTPEPLILARHEGLTSAMLEWVRVAMRWSP